MSFAARRPPSRGGEGLTEDERARSAREALDILYEMATLLNTGLDRQQLASCVKLLEDGTNPDALASVVRDLRAEARKRRGEDA